ncbi:MAG: peptidyl-prolyl cis-trans isomerase, partial [Gammaproteobacteria bacterium]
ARDRMVVKLLKDPLLHFLALGALLFAVSLVRDERGDDPDRIVIDAATVERVAEAARRLHGREPTRDELRELLEPHIRDEVLYREALALGLDENDDEVRRRLIEKMQYLTQDLADPEPPSEEALREYFATHAERFVLPETITFEQVFFSPQMRGESLDASVEEGLRLLRDGADPAGIGDRTPLRFRYDDAERARVEVLFGAEMTDALFSAAPGSWDGPYESDFGLHLAKVVEHRPARRRTFDEARDDVVAAYAAERRAERNEAEYARMRARYDIVVEWPDADDASRAAANGAGS